MSARTRGPHFFVAPGDLDGEVAALRGDEARHLATVLRARPGDPVSLSDGNGRVWQARLERVQATAATCRIDDAVDVPPPRPRTHVVHALPKARKLDEVVQRLTELGVDRIAPVHSRQSQVVLSGPKAEKAVARWRAVALAAAKQSRRAWLPEIADVGEWTAAFGDAPHGVVAWEGSDVPLRRALQALPSDLDEVVIAVGPEGGLTADEVAAAGLPHASLGPTVLRTETAALVVTAAVRSHLGLLA